ncbi:MAG TPA: RES domain-containing protein [Vicinamibacterales bacterium]|nr:RES domain-containing protein [Vicinamibacterales bacterium]
MLVTAWRIVKARYADHAFDGEGARLEGGRWNSPGTPMVYTSDSAALAALEMLVHLGRRSVLNAYVLIPCTFDEAIVGRLDEKKLPDDWRSSPAPQALQMLGDDWAKSGRSAVLRVPGVIMAGDSNFLLNPNHPDFQRVRVLRARPFAFDARLG